MQVSAIKLDVIHIIAMEGIPDHQAQDLLLAKTKYIVLRECILFKKSSG